MIEWAEFDANNLDFSLYVSNVSVSKSPLQLNIKPNLGFPWDNSTLCFLQQRPMYNNEYMRSYRCAQLNANEAPIELTKRVIEKLNQMIKSTNDYTILDKIIDIREVIAIFRVDDKYVFLDREDKTITYCFSDRHLFNKGVSLQF